MILLFILSLFAIGDVNGACGCTFENQSYDPIGWPNFWLQNAFDSETNVPCVMDPPCTHLLDSTKTDGQGIGNYLQITWDASVTGVINLYDSNPAGERVGIILEGIGPNDVRTPRASTGQYVLVVMNLTSKGNVLSTMTVTDKTVLTPSTTAAPPTTTTPPYIGNLSNNPALISNDLLIMIDQGVNSPNTPADFQNSKKFAAAVVNTIASSVFYGVASDSSPVTGTRLSLNYLNYVNTGAAVAPWLDNSSVIADQIINLPQLQSKKTNFATALQKLLDDTSIFNPENQADQSDLNSRNTAQRILLVVASSPPDSGDGIFGTTLNFAKYNIHPIFVAYNFGLLNTTNGGNTVSSLGNNGWNVTSVGDFSDATINSFIEEHFLKNTLCPIPKLDFSADDTSNSVIRYGFMEKPETTDFYIPQYLTNRYCNFQKMSYTVTKSVASDMGYCFTVFYELEVEKDTLKFYQCSTDTSDCKDGTYIEYASLSGTDVSGSRFCFTRSTRIDFSTNESGVYGGFYIKIDKTPS